MRKCIFVGLALFGILTMSVDAVEEEKKSAEKLSEDLSLPVKYLDSLKKYIDSFVKQQKQKIKYASSDKGKKLHEGNKGLIKDNWLYVFLRSSNMEFFEGDGEKVYNRFSDEKLFDLIFSYETKKGFKGKPIKTVLGDPFKFALSSHRDIFLIPKVEKSLKEALLIPGTGTYAPESEEPALVWGTPHGKKAPDAPPKNKVLKTPTLAGGDTKKFVSNTNLFLEELRKITTKEHKFRKISYELQKILASHRYKPGSVQKKVEEWLKGRESLKKEIAGLQDNWTEKETELKNIAEKCKNKKDYKALLEAINKLVLRMPILLGIDQALNEIITWRP